MPACLVCGRSTKGGPRCARHQDPEAAARRRLRASRAWRNLAHARIAAWVEEHGWLCPGWRRDPHEVGEGELTYDHPVALAAGGDPLPERGTVLCRTCNSRKGVR